MAPLASGILFLQARMLSHYLYIRTSFQNVRAFQKPIIYYQITIAIKLYNQAKNGYLFKFYPILEFSEAKIPNWF